MFRRKRRYQPPPQPSPRPVAVRIPGMEQLVANIADLTTAVNNLVGVEQSIVDALTHPRPPTGTVLTAEDQAALDSAVTTVQSVAATLRDALPVTPPTSSAPTVGTTDADTAPTL